MKRQRLEPYPRYFQGSIDFTKANNCFFDGEKIDMGWNTGISHGIYKNLFKWPAKILNPKNKPVRQKSNLMRLLAEVNHGSAIEKNK